MTKAQQRRELERLYRNLVAERTALMDKAEPTDHDEMEIERLEDYIESVLQGIDELEAEQG